MYVKKTYDECLSMTVPESPSVFKKLLAEAMMNSMQSS